ncbi:Protein of unknown function [Anaerovirgula multivorans]|uniref:Metal-dependent enzyme n=1 Tax=Anaerovirgula multivorans TaxID=312168 RepID=A0A239BIB1_9FIRM|nr:DUF1385 domain-containing protein [Anaerovirgula multivorans]SNS07710.1 Protein of unknown function [Anaerovirgula multivorans]
MKLGGYAHNNGITFFCDVLKVKTTKVKEDIQYEVDWILPKRWLRKLEGKFILGGILVGYYQWRIMNIKYKILMTLLIALILLEEIFHLPLFEGVSTLPINQKWFYGMMVLTILVNIRKIIRLFQHHGAEHKVINCYTKHGYVNRYLVKKASRFNKRCGSNLGLIIIILYSILWFFNIDSILWFFLIFLVAVQIAKKFALTNTKWDKYINILQWITVLEPKEEDIDLAINAFNYLLHTYEIYRKESTM